MRGDFTRSTFRREKHYSGVRLQQGRVQLDADWNEQLDIQHHHDRAALRDAVGPSGVPVHAEDEFRHFRLRPSALPFELTPGVAGGPVLAAGESLDIAQGHLYVEGLLCENEADTNAAGQPYLARNAPLIRQPDGTLAPLPAPAGTYLAYLDAWERDVSALEDPAIREDALGGPDTATRTQAIWQVGLLALGAGGGEGEAGVHCLSDIPAWDELVRPSPARLRARTQRSETEGSDPCIVPPGGGFRRLENQLYRVEVHRGGTPDAATFKWSRENASIATDWLAQDGDNLTVASAGRDGPLGFAPGQWVELTDDTRELLGRPGILVQLADVRGQILTINPATADRVPVAEAPDSTEPPDAAGTVPAPIQRDDFPLNPKVRRWDLPATATGAPVITVPTDADTFVPLEDGVEVRFEANGAGPDDGAAIFRSGDYWLIPARTLKADVEWPVETGPAGDRPAALAPHGVRHRFCRLALVRADEAGQLTLLPGADCRPRFPALTELTALFYVGGDGQSARPPEAGQPGTRLHRPLHVGVANGQWPVAGARVRFATVPPDNGTLEREDGSDPGHELIVETGADGLAECRWRLSALTADGANRTQLATATLLDVAGEAHHLPVRFYASLSLADEVGYTPGDEGTTLADVATVQEALDELFKQGDGVPGIHVREVRTVSPDTEIVNDGSLSAPLLVEGLRVLCDAPVDKRALIGKPVCTLTLELPFPFNQADRDLWGDGVIGFQPLVLRGDAEPRDEEIVWLPADEVRKFLLDTLFAQMTDLGRGTRVLARLTLYGNFIYGGEDGSLYLDGDTFGVPARDDSTGLDLPSGDRRRGGDFRMWFWLEPERPGLKSVTLEQTSVIGGAQFKGFVTLSARAPAGTGSTVNVTSDNPAVTITPQSVLVPPGQFSGEFTVQTNPVAASQTVTITATFPDSEPQTVKLTVEPPRLQSLTLPADPTGQPTVSGTVTLNGRAPTGGIAVALASGNPQLATVPGQVTVVDGQQSANFQVTRAGQNGGQVTVTGTLVESRTATLRLLPRLTQFTLSGSATAVVRGRSIGGQVTIGNAVPFEVRVTLTNNNPGVASVPAVAIVPPNALTGAFTISTGSAMGLTGITAALQGSPSLFVQLAVLPRLTQLTLSSSSVASGDTAQGTVRVEAAPPLAMTIALGSSNTSVASPEVSSVQINANTLQATFFVGTGFVSTVRSAVISASLAGVVPLVTNESQLSATLTVQPVIKDFEKIVKEFDKFLKEKEFDDIGIKGREVIAPFRATAATRQAPSAGGAGEATAQAFIRADERPQTDQPPVEALEATAEQLQADQPPTPESTVAAPTEPQAAPEEPPSEPEPPVTDQPPAEPPAAPQEGPTARRLAAPVGEVEEQAAPEGPPAGPEQPAIDEPLEAQAAAAAPESRPARRRRAPQAPAEAERQAAPEERPRGRRRTPPREPEQPESGQPAAEPPEAPAPAEAERRAGPEERPRARRRTSPREPAQPASDQPEGQEGARARRRRQSPRQRGQGAG